MERKCGVCGRKRDEDEMYVIHTTEKEREAIRGMGAQPLDSYAYCRPCWGITADKTKGAQLLKGQVQTRIQSAGVPAPVAERYGNRVYEFLVTKAKPKSS